MAKERPPERAGGAAAVAARWPGQVWVLHAVLVTFCGAIIWAMEATSPVNLAARSAKWRGRRGRCPALPLPTQSRARQAPFDVWSRGAAVRKTLSAHRGVFCPFFLSRTR